MAQPILDKNSNGEWVEYRGNRWRPYKGVTPDDVAKATQEREQYRQENPILDAMMPGLFGVSKAAGSQYWGGAATGLSENEFKALEQQYQEQTPWAYGVGQGAASLGMGAALPGNAAAQIVGGAGLGALQTDDPTQGAMIGGTLGAAVPAFGGLYRGAKALGQNPVQYGNMAERGLTRVAEQLDVMGANTMANRVSQRLGMVDDVGGAGRTGNALTDAVQATDDSGQVLAGFLKPDEARTMGLNLTAGDELALTARNADELAHAERVRKAEELRRTDPLTGGGIDDIRSSQKDWVTDAVKQRLGIEGNVNLTDDVLGSKLSQLGDEFNQFADDVGSVPLTPQYEQAIADIAEQATGAHSGLVKSFVDDLYKMIAQNDGALSGKDWQTLRTRLGKMMDAGSRQGDYAKVSDAGDLQGVLIEALESNLPLASRESIATTRHQYGLTKTLLKRQGNLSSDGRVNPRSLYGSMKTASKIRNRQDNDLLRMLETSRYLTDKVVPSSGTAERLMANPGRTGIQAATGIGLGGGGLAAFNMLTE